MKRFLAAVPVLWFSATILSAADTPAPRAPNKEEAAKGWIALFDGDSSTGWVVPNGSKWTITDGYLAPQAEGPPGLLVTSSAFRDYELIVEYRIRNGKDPIEVLVGCDKNGAGKRKNGPDVPKVEDKDPPEVAPVTGIRLQYLGNTWAQLRLSVVEGNVTSTSFQTVGDNFPGLVGGFATATKSVGATPPPPPKPGHIALSGNGVVFRSIKLRPSNGKSLFNGKDLTGWKAFEGDKPKVQSKFSVSPEGWLTIKNGPGDLQTEGQWADFIFQGECRTNGKNLNSGVFFRCRPGEYQQGYEAQIHNGSGETLKKYNVMDYDPKTHELKERRTVESKAVDYGTGAIYNRIPASRMVAKDGEWFELTIVAQGNHIATWVDGVQVVDWTDNRPQGDNARNGCRLEKGPISLQGHDPTTDLNFRNMSVIDLAGAAEKKKE
jgi:hypothetical protein